MNSKNFRVQKCHSVSACLQNCLTSTFSSLNTAKTVYQKFKTNIPRNETAWPQPNSYIYVSASDLYIPTIDLPILFCCRKIGGLIVGIYI